MICICVLLYVVSSIGMTSASRGTGSIPSSGAPAQESRSGFLPGGELGALFFSETPIVKIFQLTGFRCPAWLQLSERFTPADTMRWNALLRTSRVPYRQRHMTIPLSSHAPPEDAFVG